jgi:hypothetical protein
VPRFMTQLNKQGLPIAAILVNFTIGMFLFLPLPNWQAMVGFLVSGMVLSYAIGPVALLCLRRDLPHEKRYFKLPIPEILCGLAFYFCTLISYWTGWETIYKLGIALGIGMLIFTVAYLRGKLHAQQVWFKAAIWVVPYITGLIMFSYVGAFGGKNLMPFGWDFLVLALFSILILYLAVKYRHNEITVNFARFTSQREVVAAYSN